MPTHTCINCDTKVESSFCPNCGQKTQIRPITWKGLFAELSSRWLGMDNRLARTFVNLWRRPDVVIENYLQGNRVRYVGPLSYLVIMSALYIFSFSIFGVSTAEFLQDSSENFQASNQSEQQAAFMTDFMGKISDNMRLLVASLIPFMALGLITMYRRRNYLENFLLVSYITSQMLWLSILGLGIFAYAGYNPQVPAFLINVAYFAWVVGKMNPQKSKIWTYLKSIFAWLVGYIYFMLFVMVLTIIAVIFMTVAGG